MTYNDVTKMCPKRKTAGAIVSVCSNSHLVVQRKIDPEELKLATTFEGLLEKGSIYMYGYMNHDG